MLRTPVINYFRRFSESVLDQDGPVRMVSNHEGVVRKLEIRESNETATGIDESSVSATGERLLRQQIAIGMDGDARSYPSMSIALPIVHRWYLSTRLH